MDAESDLYFKASKLVEFLVSWTPQQQGEENQQRQQRAGDADGKQEYGEESPEDGGVVGVEDGSIVPEDHAHQVE